MIKFMTVSEYERYLSQLRGYAYNVNDLIDEVTRTAGAGSELAFTATQLKCIFELADDRRR